MALLLRATVLSGFFHISPLLTADFHRCSKALSAKEQDPAPCLWFQRVYKSLCPISWVRFPRRVQSWAAPARSCIAAYFHSQISAVLLCFLPRVCCRFRNGTGSEKQKLSLEKSEELSAPFTSSSLECEALSVQKR